MSLAEAGKGVPVNAYRVEDVHRLSLHNDDRSITVNREDDHRLRRLLGSSDLNQPSVHLGKETNMSLMACAHPKGERHAAASGAASAIHLP